MKKTQEQKFMAGLTKEFANYVQDCMEDKLHEGCKDHYDFMRRAMENFIALKEGDEE